MRACPALSLSDSSSPVPRPPESPWAKPVPAFTGVQAPAACLRTWFIPGIWVIISLPWLCCRMGISGALCWTVPPCSPPAPLAPLPRAQTSRILSISLYAEVLKKCLPNDCKWKSFIKYLLNYHMLCTVLGARDKQINNNDSISCHVVCQMYA